MTNIRSDTLASLMIYAARYAMGRRSYAVEQVTSAISTYAAALTLRDTQTILTDITEAQARGELGDAQDIKRWLWLADRLREVIG